MADKITIICRNPGMRRAGIKHPASATYDADKFSEAELAAFRADPAFEVIDGTGHSAEAELAIAEALEALRQAQNKETRLTAEIATLQVELADTKGKLKASHSDRETLKSELETAATKIAALEQAAEKAAKTTAKK